ncbi:MAG: PD-(D/E)XK nuclease superfamily protein [Vicinamibacterales bacterium]
MSPGATGTGAVLEAMILPALAHGGYTTRSQVNIGHRLGRGKHRIDAIAEKNGKAFLVSLKWQQTSGTAEQKVPFEAICLSEALMSGSYERAYIVLGGDGWSLRDFYTTGGLDRHLNNLGAVKIVTLERFIALANSGRLSDA